MPLASQGAGPERMRSSPCGRQKLPVLLAAIVLSAAHRSAARTASAAAQQELSSSVRVYVYDLPRELLDPGARTSGGWG